MTSLGDPPDLVPMICTYRAYFSSPETDPFSGYYKEVLEPYFIYPMNEVAAQMPASVSQKIYTASQQGDPTAFLLCHATPGISDDWDSGRVLLLHSVSQYTSRMGRTSRKWDNTTFANLGDVSYGTTPLAVWDPTYPHLTPTVYVPSAATIDTSLDGDSNVKLLGPYGPGDTRIEIIPCPKTVYVPAPYVVLLLSADLSPVEPCNRLRGAIVDAVAEAACQPIIDWLRATIIRSGPNTHSALVVPDPSAPLPHRLLIQHRRRLLLIHLPGLNQSINWSEVTRIAETFG